MCLALSNDTPQYLAKYIECTVTGSHALDKRVFSVVKPVPRDTRPVGWEWPFFIRNPTAGVLCRQYPLPSSYIGTLIGVAFCLRPSRTPAHHA